MMTGSETARVGVAITVLVGALTLVVSYASAETGWGVSPPFQLDTRGCITGTVVDAFNWDEYGQRVRPIRDVQIQARDVSTQEVYEAFSNSAGEFTISVPGGSSYECVFSHHNKRGCR